MYEVCIVNGDERMSVGRFDNLSMALIAAGAALDTIGHYLAPAFRPDKVIVVRPDGGEYTIDG